MKGGIRCPGQDTRAWGPEALAEAACPSCGGKVEFWKDEPRRRCRSCGAVVRNPKVDSGCAAWCKFARECLGYAPEAPGDAPAVSGRIIAAMRVAAGADRVLVARSLAALEHAEALLVAEGGSPVLVVAAATLHALGAARARELAVKAGLDEPTSARIGSIVAFATGEGSSDAASSKEAAIVKDAVLLAECFGDGISLPGRSSATDAEDRLATPSARERARALAARTRPARKTGG